MTLAATGMAAPRGGMAIFFESQTESLSSFDISNPKLRELKADIRALSSSCSRVSARQLIAENVLLPACYDDRNEIRFVEVLPTGVCNHACSWCFTASSRGGTLDAGALRARLYALTQSGGRAVLFSGGGEPLLCPYLMKPDAAFDAMTVIEWLGERNVSTALITNGALLSRFVERVGAAIRSMAFVRISLDACDPGTYSIRHGTAESDFQKVLDGIADLRSLRAGGYQPAIGISFVVGPEALSFGELKQVRSLARSIGADFVQLKHRHVPETAVSEADSTMKAVYVACTELDWGETEYWVHRYLTPKAMKSCVVPTVAQVLGTADRQHACCHLQHIPLPKSEDGAWRGFSVTDCSSSVCRHVSLNSVLQKVESPSSYARGLDVLRASLARHGYHPFRLFPSSPDLFGYSELLNSQ